MKEKKSRKLTFKLSEEEAGPFPVSVESLWCDCEGAYFRVKNIPFFLENLSLDDLIEIKEDKYGNSQIDRIVSPSLNSTVWVYIKDKVRGTDILDKIRNLGCELEGGVFDGYFAVNVPERVRLGELNEFLSEVEEKGWALVDYPSIRHLR